MGSMIRITAEPAVDPEICRFTLDRVILPFGKVSSSDPRAARGSRLFEEVLAVRGVREVLVEGGTVTVARSEPRDWREMGPEIGAAIRRALAAETPLFQDVPESPAEEEFRPGVPEDAAGREIFSAVSALLDARVNPSVASHGGHVTLAGVTGATVFLRLEGGCQGCGMAKVTLRQGIERSILEGVPSVRRVVDVTDHASGETPYYHPSKS
jgi:Fe-S cluster biogenesis protein NfuA